MKGAPRPVDPHWIEAHRRYALGGGLAPPGPAGPAPSLHQFGLYAVPPGHSQLDRERLERLGKNLNSIKIIYYLINNSFHEERDFLYDGKPWVLTENNSIVYLSAESLIIRINFNHCCLLCGTFLVKNCKQS